MSAQGLGKAATALCAEQMCLAPVVWKGLGGALIALVGQTDSHGWYNGIIMECLSFLFSRGVVWSGSACLVVVPCPIRVLPYGQQVSNAQ